MMHIRSVSTYRKSYRRFSKSGRFPSQKLDAIIDALARGEKLDHSFKDHALSGKFADCRECHIKSDLLLVYKIENNNLLLVLVNLGSHPSLFE